LITLKLIEFFGPSNSGKTFAITEMVKRLKKHGYSVATVKSTHHSLDYENDSKDSMKYLNAGSNLSVAMGENETVFHLPRKIKLFELLDHINYDFVLVEGETGFPMPKILFLNETEGLERCDDLTIAIVGDMKDQKDLQVQTIKPRDYETLYTTVLSKAMPPLPGDDCGHCGSDCTTMMIGIIKGEKTYKNCVKLSKKSVNVEFDGKSVPILPFISSIISDVNTGILKNLKGMKKQGHVKIEFDLKN
jgi:molybdopterin-guanine dinucleotide biosynthesis protein B